MTDKALLAKYLEHIMDNAELFCEWIQEGRDPWKFLLTALDDVTEKDIEWAQGEMMKINLPFPPNALPENHDSKVVSLKDEPDYDR